MQSSRHFLVKRIGEHYYLREIEAVLAQSLLWSGAFPQRLYGDHHGSYAFYFVHTPLPCPQNSTVIAELLSHIQRDSA